MDRNSIIGVVLIIVVLIGFALFNQPSQEELQTAKHKRDSIAQSQKKEHDIVKIKQGSTFLVQAGTHNNNTMNDRIKEDKLKLPYGDFAPAANGEEKNVTLETNLL